MGAQQCYAPDGQRANPSTTGLGTCLNGSSPAITCSSANIVAQGCVTGTYEQVDCTAISGSGTCVATDAGVAGTMPSDACFVLDGGCAADMCGDAGDIVACVRGRPVDVGLVRRMGLGALQRRADRRGHSSGPCSF